MSRTEFRQVFFRQLEEFNGRAQTPAVLCVRWAFEVLLEMDESARRLNQSFEEIVLLGVAIQDRKSVV